MEEVTSALLGPAVSRFKGSQCPQSSSFNLLSEPAQALPIHPPFDPPFPLPSHTQVLQVRQSREGVVSDQRKLVGIE